MTFIWELIARIYRYDPERVPDWLVGNYARVADSCMDLSARAWAFYAALGLC